MRIVMFYHSLLSDWNRGNAHFLRGITTELLARAHDDTESLFTPGRDFLLARNGTEMQDLLQALLQNGAMAHELAGDGLQTILRRHTCAHRVDELSAIYAELEGRRLQAGEIRCAVH
jgi:spore maturation protein CgeB